MGATLACDGAPPTLGDVTLADGAAATESPCCSLRCSDTWYPIRGYQTNSLTTPRTGPERRTSGPNVTHLARRAMYPRRLGAWRTEAFRNRPVAAPFRSEVSHWVEGRMRGRMVLACLQDFASERSDMKSLKPKNTERNHGAYCCLARRAMYPHRLGAWRTGAFRNCPVATPFRREVSHWVEDRMRGRMALGTFVGFHVGTFRRENPQTEEHRTKPPFGWVFSRRGAENAEIRSCREVYKNGN